MAIKLLPDLETQQRIADATEELVNKILTADITISGDSSNITFNGSNTNYLTTKTKVEGAVKELDTRVKVNADRIDNVESGKQDKLTAGTNITINSDTNVISASNNYNDLINKPYIPEKTSDLTNDSDFTTKTYVDDEIDGKIGDIDFSEFIKSVNDKTPNQTGGITLTHEDVNAVPLSRKISGLILNGDISEADLRDTLQEATIISKGLMSNTDKEKLESLWGIFDAGDSTFVDTLVEIMEVFENYPEGTSLFDLIGTKVTKNTPITGNTKTKITYDSKGLVTGGSTLDAVDIPLLDVSKITSGRFIKDRLPADTVYSAGLNTLLSTKANVDDLTWSQITSKPTFATVATSGSYNDLSNKPTIPEIPSVMNTTEGNTGTATTQRTINAANLKSIILNHSPAGSRQASDVYPWAKAENKPSYSKSEVGLGNVDNTTDLAKPISTATQNALSLKADKTDIPEKTSDLTNDSDFTTTIWVNANTRSNTWTPSWGQVTDKPSVIIEGDSRLTDERPASDVSLWAKASTKPSYNKSEVGLGNVNNTADIDKPISTATQTALNLKADKTQLNNYVTTSVFDMQMLEKLAIKPNGTDLLIIGGMINPLYIDDASYKVNHPTVSSQAAMLALDVPAGTVVVRLDTPSKELFLLTQLPASTLANWQVVSSNTIVSVAGKTGVVVLGITDISGLTNALNLKLDITTFESQLTQLQTAIANKVDKIADKGLSTNDLTNALKSNYDTAYTHSQTAHAPSNAQKNSDITKAEIEAKLTGQITSHSHALPTHNHDDRYYTESEVDTKLVGKANATHTHTKSEITDFPTSMPPTAHNHDSDYYKKSEAYSKTEIDTMIGDIDSILDSILGV